MSLELLDSNSFHTLERDKSTQEAVYAGLESMQTLVHLLSYHSNTPKEHKFHSFLQRDCSVVAKATIAKFKKAVSLLSRPGHARVRRAPTGRRRAAAAASLAHLSKSAMLEALASCNSSDGNGNMESCNRASASSQDSQAQAEGSRTQIKQLVHVKLAHSDMHVQSMRDDILSRLADVAHMPKANISHTPSFERILSMPCTDSSVGTKQAYADSCVPLPQTAMSLPDIQERAKSAMLFGPQDFLAQGLRMGGRAAAQEALCNGRSTTTSYSQYEHSISCTPPPSTTASSFLSSLSIDGSVTNGKMSVLRQVIGGGRPPASRKCPGDEADGKCHSAGKCHCSKRRKHRNRREVRVPCVSSKVADIPTDDFSWRKYGQKPIKGSPHPRGYYKCSTVRGCPARKHVERAVDEANMLIVTYEGEHNHSPTPNDIV